MSDSRFRLPHVGGQLSARTGECPSVADLIDYALDRAGTEDRQRIETHLKNSGCGHCRSWIDKAGTPASAKDPPPGKSTLTSASKWRQEAFRDLEERLTSLEEG
jgi:hypothetical protein